MKPRIPLAVAAAAAAVAAMAVSAVPASATAATSTSTSTDTALSQLTMTKSGSVNRQVTLECDPTGGTHPTPDDACAKLTAVNGRFDLLQRAPGVFCTANFDPVTVTVLGNWQFQQVNFTKTYTNDCEASVGSNFVFRF